MEFRPRHTARTGHSRGANRKIGEARRGEAGPGRGEAGWGTASTRDGGGSTLGLWNIGNLFG